MSNQNSGIAFSKLQRLAKVEQDSDTRLTHVDSDADEAGLLKSIAPRQQINLKEETPAVDARSSLSRLKSRVGH